jgi:flagellar L-ring protein FlgH
VHETAGARGQGPGGRGSGNLQFAVCNSRFAVPRPRVAALAVVVLMVAAGQAAAQSSSLFGSPGGRPALDIFHNWVAEKPLEPQPIELHDIISVTINESSVVISEGQMDRKKTAYGDLILKNWILLKGLSAKPDPQTAGSPHIRGELDNKMQSHADLETRDSMKFHIACSVVDIRPNGNLVVEGRREIHNNNELWEYSLSGEVRTKDIMPNNTINSENVAEMKLFKKETVHVRDGYRRGWMLKWLDYVQPF